MSRFQQSCQPVWSWSRGNLTIGHESTRPCFQCAAYAIQRNCVRVLRARSGHRYFRGDSDSEFSTCTEYRLQGCAVQLCVGRLTLHSRALKWFPLLSSLPVVTVLFFVSHTARTTEAMAAVKQVQWMEYNRLQQCLAMGNCLLLLLSWRMLGCS
jgi:hypothetical protein